jgi:hypothetical protein
MKSSEEWQNSGNGGLSASLSFIRRVQADALRHAAEICRVNSRVHSNPGLADCHERDAERIEAQAAKLEAKQ